MICGVVVVIVFGLSYKENGPPGEMFYGLCARRSFCGLKGGGFFGKNGSWGVFMGWEFLNFLAKRGGVCEGLKSWLNLRGLTIFISRIRLRPSLRPPFFLSSTPFSPPFPSGIFFNTPFSSSIPWKCRTSSRWPIWESCLPIFPPGSRFSRACLWHWPGESKAWRAGRSRSEGETEEMDWRGLMFRCVSPAFRLRGRHEPTSGSWTFCGFNGKPTPSW